MRRQVVPWASSRISAKDELPAVPRGDDPLAIRPLAAVPDVPRGETDEAKKLAAAQAKAAGAATLAYMRSRVSSPRDMSAAAATAFRAACEVCLASVY